MGIFRRRGRHDRGGNEGTGAGGSPLPALKPEDANALLALSRDRLAQMGREGIIGDGVIEVDGMSYGLHNLSVLVADAPRRKWPDLVDQHFKAMLAIESAKPEDAVLLVSLRNEADIPTERFSYPVRSPLPAVVAPLALDYPTHVADSFDLPDGFESADARYREALAHLTALPPPEHQTFLADENEATSRIHVFVGDDFFVASRVHLLPQVMAAAGVDLPATGALVAVPNRHLLAVAPVTGLGIVTSSQTLLALADGEHRDRPGPISPDIFHVLPDGSAMRAGHVDPETRSASLTVDGSLAEAFAQLGLIEGS